MKSILTNIALLSVAIYFLVAAIGENSNHDNKKELLILSIEKTKLEIQKLKVELGNDK